MEHRKWPLWDVATYLLLNRQEMRPLFDTLRVRWGQLLRDGEPNQLRLLIERLNPENYVRRLLPDGTPALVLKWPEDIARKHESESSNIQADFEIMGLPRRARRWLDSEEAVPSDVRDHLWELRQKLASQALHVDLSNAVFDPRDALYALVATLVACCSDWLELEPARATWCREQLEQALGIRREFSPPANDGRPAPRNNLLQVF
jgi:hypothetical protein